MFPIISQNRYLQVLINQNTLKDYGRNLPSQQAGQQLAELTMNELFGRVPTNSFMAKSVLSGLWLLHGFLDESHTISQDLKTPEGSFWHAIMHRLEGDFWNSKYWYRQAGKHPVDQVVQSRLDAEGLKLMGGLWSPSRFVDLCQSESARQGSKESSVVSHHSTEMTGAAVHRIAVVEWESLFEYCWSAA